MTKTLKEIQKEIFSAEFSKFCRKNIQTPMQAVEKRRFFYIFALFFVAFIGLLVEAFFIFIIIKGELRLDDSAELIVLPIAATIGICNWIIKCYKTNAKKIILPNILSYMGDFSLVEKSSIIHYLGHYLHTLDLMPNFNKELYDDCLEGIYNGVRINIAETELIVKGHKSSKTVFKGLFVHCKSNKKFNYKTIIKRNSSCLFSNRDKVNLEDPEFEKIFDVYGDDQIEARYLITPAFMTRMVELSKKGIGKGITVSFEYGNINIAISESKDWFEIPLFKPATEISNYRGILLELISIFSIIDTLKLDQNIGA